MLQVFSLPVLKDNCSYVLRDETSRKTAIVDPGDAAPLIDFLEARSWRPDLIWNTHHHWDHIGGNDALRKKYQSKIWCSSIDSNQISGSDRGLSDEEFFDFGNFKFQALHIPGHTWGHMALFCESEKMVFTGDTLFSLGCGKVFTEDYEKMFSSLCRLAKLPLDTKIFSGHEYTLSNLKFLESLNPESSLVQLRESIENQIRKNQTTQGSTIQFELTWNPFLKSKNLSEFKNLRIKKNLYSS